MLAVIGLGVIEQHEIKPHTTMNTDQYFKDRLEPEIIWYDTKSIFNKRWYYGLQIAQIVMAATIPVLAGFVNDQTPSLKVFIGIAGALVAIITGLLNLGQFQRKWIEYRTICESLKHHKFRFLATTTPYDSADTFKIFVNNIEALISKENTNWAEYMRDKKKEQSNG